MEDYLASEIAAQSMLTNQVVLQAIQYLGLLVAGSVALVTVVALLVVVAGLLWRGLQTALTAQSSSATTPFNLTTKRLAMKKIVTTTLLLCGALLATAIAAQAQTQDRATTNGPVWRISEY
jgi:uncharacterized membrane protein